MTEDPRNPETTPLTAPTRRDLLRAAGGLGLAAVGGFGGLGGLHPEPASAAQPTGTPAATPAAPRSLRRVAVVGAGAFGGWTALALRRRGFEVDLFDAWGPGHVRSSSGGETRVIRGMYGADRIYVEWVVRSFELWRDAERRLSRTFYHPTGVLWMFAVDDAYARTSLPLLAAAGLPVDQLPLATARARWPQIRFDGVRSVYVEREAGYLTARLACQAVAEALVREGGTLRRLAARPGAIESGRLTGLALSDGSTHVADAHVFACGPWLGQIFPEVVGDGVRPTRQEVFYFGSRAGDGRFDEGTLPIWIEFAERIHYGLSGNLERGFKVADDTRGEPIDPTTGDRTLTPARIADARELLARRFPDLAEAPLLGGEVCQYENSPDGHLIAGTHPEAANLWILGGGSGHGFKFAPALGENAAAWIAGEKSPPAMFALGRLAALGGRPDAKTQFSNGG